MYKANVTFTLTAQSQIYVLYSQCSNQLHYCFCFDEMSNICVDELPMGTYHKQLINGRVRRQTMLTYDISADYHINFTLGRPFFSAV